eukprot:Skav230496  [mRNA]  locus=scaffold2389:158016:161560:- [translate_table: standard]
MRTCRRLAPSFAGSGRRSALDAYKRSAGGCDSDLSEVRRRKGDEARRASSIALYFLPREAQRERKEAWRLAKKQSEAKTFRGKLLQRHACSCVQEPSAQEPSECGGDWALWRTSPTLTRRLAPSFAGSGRRSALDAYKRSAGGCDSDLSEVRRRKGDEASSGEALPLNPRGNRQP